VGSGVIIYINFLKLGSEIERLMGRYIQIDDI
jgi:hypothetical protein